MKNKLIFLTAVLLLSLPVMHAGEAGVAQPAAAPMEAQLAAEYMQQYAPTNEPATNFLQLLPLELRALIADILSSSQSAYELGDKMAAIFRVPEFAGLLPVMLDRIHSGKNKAAFVAGLNMPEAYPLLWQQIRTSAAIKEGVKQWAIEVINKWAGNGIRGIRFSELKLLFDLLNGVPLANGANLAPALSASSLGDVLQTAIGTEQVDLVSFLLQSKFDPNLRHDESANALEWTLQLPITPATFEIFHMLLENNAQLDPNKSLHARDVLNSLVRDPDPRSYDILELLLIKNEEDKNVHFDIQPLLEKLEKTIFEDIKERKRKLLLYYLERQSIQAKLGRWFKKITS